jgi:CRISPR-associated protein Cas1
MDVVFNTYGASLSYEKNCFVVRGKDGIQKIPVDDVNSISLGKGAQITSDAIFLAIDNEVDILFNDKSGKPQGRIWSHKYGSISTIRKGQINFTQSRRAVEWIKDIITQKIENQQALISMINTEEISQKRYKEKSIARLQEYIDKIKSLEGEHIAEIASQLRGWEGISSKIYFESLSVFAPKEYHFTGRTQRPAMDIFNALLNYGYGILYGKVEGALIKAGIDPYIGVLHRDEYNRPVLAYDVIERYRIWIDFIVYHLLQQQIITDEFYSKHEDGSFWLESLGRRVIIQMVNDYLEENITINGLSRSRATHLQLYAQDLAQQFKLSKL